MAKDAEREKRLAEALRANLKRRKAQQRGGPDETPSSKSAVCDGDVSSEPTQD
jgi:hypothetical protein